MLYNTKFYRACGVQLDLRHWEWIQKQVKPGVRPSNAIQALIDAEIEKGK